MDKELEDIKPIEKKRCCSADLPKASDPNCCRIVHKNTLPSGMTYAKWCDLSHEEKYNIAIANNWRSRDGNYLRESQPQYDPHKQDFEPT